MDRAEDRGGGVAGERPVLLLVRPDPGRVLRFYAGIALALTLGPLVFGLWSGLVGYLLTQCSAGEVLERCVELVGFAPVFGLAFVLLAVPAAWMVMSQERRQSWRVDSAGISICRDEAEVRRLGWDAIDTVRVGVQGPTLLLKDRSAEGEQLVFVRRETSIELHRLWMEWTRI